MIKADRWREIHSRRGLRETKKSIARAMGLHIQTIRKVLRQEAPVPSAPWKRSQLGINKFVGNLKGMTVHERLFRTPEWGIEEIPAEAIEFFSPDTLEAVEAIGFTACPRCLPYNQKIK